MPGRICRLDRLDLLELRISHVFEQPSAASEQDPAEQS
jgi:hypothetical protein